MDSEDDSNDSYDDIEVDDNDDHFENHVQNDKKYVKPNSDTHAVPVEQKINAKYYLKPKKKVEEDEEDEYLKDAIAQIMKEEAVSADVGTAKSVGLNVTTEGVSQDQYKTINLAKVKDLLGCSWCGKYFNNEIIIIDKDGSVCKHCMFSVNYDEKTRLDFDTECAKKGTGIALYIIECKDAHNTNGCTRYPYCYLCDFKLGIPLKNILNSTMIGIDENGLGIGQQNTENTQGTQSSQTSSKMLFDENEKVLFVGGYDPSRKVKIPAKLKI